MTTNIWVVRFVSQSCAFAYATANTALYAVLVLTVADYWSDVLEHHFGTPPSDGLGSDITAYVLIGLLLVGMLLSNHLSYSRRVAALFFKSSVSSSSQTLLVAVEKMCAIAGTYLKTVASTISLSQLISKYSSPVVGLCVALPMLPFNAGAQFSVVGEQFSIRLLLFALLALFEVAAIGGIAFGVTWGADADHHLVALTMEVAVSATLLLEMICLVFKDVSLVGLGVHMFRSICTHRSHENFNVESVPALLYEGGELQDANEA
jgi:hypothetical protein